MRQRFFPLFLILLCINFQQTHSLELNMQQELVPEISETKEVMSKTYLNYWGPEVQDQIDRDIHRYRMANAILNLEEVSVGTEVKIEQISHHFRFGGNIFLFGDFKTPEKNKRYEETFGTLFNSATIPFYWRTLEPEKGKRRYEEGSPYIYRRPPTDPVVEFCESKEINMHGHPIIYGRRWWGHPIWMPEDRQVMEEFFEEHVRDLAERYKGRIQSWDVVNESINQAERGLMPDDYTYKTFRWAMKYFPDSVDFHINEMDIRSGPSRRHLEIIRDLIDRGIRIDEVGIQNHIFNPEDSRRIADGVDILTPERNYAVLDVLAEAELPIHISEVTVSAPDHTDAGQLIQAKITRNLYRLWFSYPNVNGISWWNLVDGGAAPGEPSFSGIYDKELQFKQVYHTLDNLINDEWKTRTIRKTDEDGVVRFRGFKGQYKVSWKDKTGIQQHAEFYLKQDGEVDLTFVAQNVRIQPE